MPTCCAPKCTNSHAQTKNILVLDSLRCCIKRCLCYCSLQVTSVFIAVNHAIALVARGDDELIWELPTVSAGAASSVTSMSGWFSTSTLTSLSGNLFINVEIPFCHSGVGRAHTGFPPAYRRVLLEGDNELEGDEPPLLELSRTSCTRLPLNWQENSIHPPCATLLYDLTKCIKAFSTSRARLRHRLITEI